MLQNILQCTKSHFDLYYSEKDFYEEADEMIMNGIGFLENFELLKELSGTNTAYGFYAPQVCGHLEPFFKVYEGDKTVVDHYNLTLKTSEASMRFSAIFGDNLERIDKLLDGKEEEEVKSDLDYRLLDLKMHSLSTTVRNLVGVGNRIEAGLYFYSTSSVTDYCVEGIGLQPSFLKTINYDYKIN
ncbi:hypothetical protein CEQ90_12060 [Lewinellaceae bacterium SD302]|nr:hypothetical protein CEQ90_12060 [Lewinellaceae bacterium SD302]